MMNTEPMNNAQEMANGKNICYFVPCPIHALMALDVILDLPDASNVSKYYSSVLTINTQHLHYFPI